MTLFSAQDDIPESARGAAIALGNFDGVHAGHRAVIASARQAAQASGALTAAAVFAPHPRRVLHPDAPPFQLQNRLQRSRALHEAGADHVFEIRFDQNALQQTDAEFAAQILAGRLGASHVSTGAHFRFGSKRMGDTSSLAKLGAQLGFTTTALSEVQGPNGQRISSTAIREAIKLGDLGEAQRMLGRPWAIAGDVERGFQRGRGLGFATANLKLGDYQRPRLGIYAVRADLGEGGWRTGVASVGINPTFEALAEPVLEAHLFDFDADLYGRAIEVELVAFLRDEAKFENAEMLARQIAEDVAEARKLLSGP
jgi:riboflavin kinase/FMN adenylyltransferase